MMDMRAHFARTLHALAGRTTKLNLDSSDFVDKSPDSGVFAFDSEIFLGFLRVLPRFEYMPHFLREGRGFHNE